MNTDVVSEPAQPTKPVAASLRWTWGVWLVYAVMLLWQPNYAWQDGDRERPYGSDYLQEYVGGHILLSDHPERLYDADHFLAVQKDPNVLGYEPAGDGYYPVVYPPWWYAVVAPLSWLPLRWAAPAWLALTTAVWFLTLRWAARSGTAMGGAMRSLAIPLVAAGPLLTTYAMGQKGGLVAAILLAIVVLLEKKRFRTAGAVCGLLIFKPHLMLLFAGPLVLRHGRPVLLGGLVTVVAAVALAAAVEPTLTGEYANVVADSLSKDYLDQDGYHLSDTHNWAGLWSRLIGFGDASRQATLVWTLATLGFMSFVALTNRDAPLTPGGWAAITLGVVLSSPHFYSYDLAVLLVPCVLAVRDATLHPKRAAFVGAMIWCGLTVLPQLSKRWPDVPVQWSTVILAVVFFGCCVRELRRPRESFVPRRVRASRAAVG